MYSILTNSIIPNTYFLLYHTEVPPFYLFWCNNYQKSLFPCNCDFVPIGQSLCLFHPAIFRVSGSTIVFYSLSLYSKLIIEFARLKYLNSLKFHFIFQWYLTAVLSRRSSSTKPSFQPYNTFSLKYISPISCHWNKMPEQSVLGKYGGFQRHYLGNGVSSQHQNSDQDWEGWFILAHSLRGQSTMQGKCDKDSW